MSRHPDFSLRTPSSVLYDAINFPDLTLLWWVYWLHCCRWPSWVWEGLGGYPWPHVQHHPLCVHHHTFLFHLHGLISHGSERLRYSLRHCITLCCICRNLPTSGPVPDYHVWPTGYNAQYVLSRIFDLNRPWSYTSECVFVTYIYDKESEGAMNAAKTGDLLLSSTTSPIISQTLPQPSLN